MVQLKYVEGQPGKALPSAVSKRCWQLLDHVILFRELENRFGPLAPRIETDKDAGVVGKGCRSCGPTSDAKGGFKGGTDG